MNINWNITNEFFSYPFTLFIHFKVIFWCIFPPNNILFVRKPTDISIMMCKCLIWKVFEIG